MNNLIVYEIKAANAEVLKHLNNLPEQKGDWSDEGYNKKQRVKKP